MEVVVGGKYRHFKGNEYIVLAIAMDSEDINRKLVIYKSLHDDKVWAREYNMFTSKVDKEKYPLAKEEYRFTYIND